MEEVDRLQVMTRIAERRLTRRKAGALALGSRRLRSRVTIEQAPFFQHGLSRASAASPRWCSARPGP